MAVFLSYDSKCFRRQDVSSLASHTFCAGKTFEEAKKDIKILIIFQWHEMGIHEVSNNKHTVLFQYLKH